eukprot:TRINITY_DN24918_c0_g1_i1.p1 TRINITY_DN24918_c0_g1~~TRINITY_DN24918_c0_g1_i1.p1  ORF type:complete len:413 (+),score=36.07 TRINITY_DN24918_c0_g1_i1:113-1351(+)
MMYLDLQVPDYKDVGSHIEYRITLIVNGEKKDHVWRRFRVLDNIFRTLRQRYPELGAPPSKIVTFFSSMTPAKITERKEQIELYLKTILRHPIACCDPQFQHVVGAQQSIIRHVFLYTTKLLVASRGTQILYSYFLRLLSYRRYRQRNGFVNKKDGVGRITQANSVGCQTVNLHTDVEELIRLQSEVKAVTERAVAAELLVSTMKFNKDSQITNTCVFLPGTPPEDKLAGGGSFFVESPDATSALSNRSFGYRTSSSRLAPFNTIGTVGRNWVHLMKKITIPRYEYRKDEYKKETLYYNIKVTTFRGESWSVWRRYNAFCGFKQSLSDAGCNSISSGFPQRISLGGVDARRSALECWLESARLAGANPNTDSKFIEIQLTTFLSPTEDDGVVVDQNQPFQDMHDQFAPRFSV